ncbi:DUF2809 domain-containing protein [Hymenobacter caeli]|uniref:DUF2809 domain-containing protein n=1 Tax=Hymenobacter caeli TaxID=2735894 RepID=A0ABX2FUZ5_9BACT|nr:DUF2809 domain-containing protein [Hymenobacter caeli]NRT21023.1 hypothetical protein [Hymenobacter caeli]
MLRFRKSYFLLASGLFLLEVFIALRLHDRFVRPYVGDFLATIFLYCLVMSVVRVPAGRAAAGALLVSYLVEGLQYLDLLTYLGWQHSRLARTVLGSHFEWPDLLAYTLGALAVVAAERARRPRAAPTGPDARPTS